MNPSNPQNTVPRFLLPAILADNAAHPTAKTRMKTRLMTVSMTVGTLLAGEVYEVMSPTARRTTSKEGMLPHSSLAWVVPEEHDG